MAKKDLQKEYEEVFGVAPEDSLTVKDLTEALENAKDVPEPEEAETPKASGRVKLGSVE